MQVRHNGRIEVFDRDYFESKLPRRRGNGQPLWERRADKGEWCYLVEMGSPEGVKILIRSSVSTEWGWSRDTGKDSIRLYLVDKQGQPVSVKLARWVTRVRGWETRMLAQMSEIRKLQQSAGACPHCNAPRKIFKVKKSGKNQGKLFAKCDCDNSFKWL